MALTMPTGSRGRIGALAPWYGGKRSLAPKIVAALGPHDAYFEPFCGSMAVLFAKPECRHEVVNDLHRDLVNVARCLQVPALARELLGRLHFTLAAEELYRESRAKVLAPFAGELGDVERAYHALVTWWLGRNGMAGCRQTRTNFCARFTKRGGSGGVRWRTLVGSVPRFAARLARVDVLNRDGVGVLDQVADEPGTAVYCDPPYLHKSSQYACDFAAADHDRLAAAAARFTKARVVVSYYPHPRLAELYPAPHWRRVELVVAKSIANAAKAGAARRDGATRATEVLLVNADVTTTEARA